MTSYQTKEITTMCDTSVSNREFMIVRGVKKWMFWVDSL